MDCSFINNRLGVSYVNGLVDNRFHDNRFFVRLNRFHYNRFFVGLNRFHDNRFFVGLNGLIYNRLFVGLNGLRSDVGVNFWSVLGRRSRYDRYFFWSDFLFFIGTVSDYALFVSDRLFNFLGDVLFNTLKKGVVNICFPLCGL